MLKLKQEQIFMLCETLLFVLITYYVYRYIKSLNTRINSLHNKVSIIETFLQEADIGVVTKPPINQSTDTQPPSNNKNVDFNPSPQILNEEELLNMINQSFNQELNNISHDYVQNTAPVNNHDIIELIDDNDKVDNVEDSVTENVENVEKLRCSEC